MINRIIEFALRNRLLVLIFVVLTAVWGIISLNNLAVDAFPDPTPPQVQIFTQAPGWAPEEVEKLVSFPIESVMNGLPDIVEVRSLSKFGLSVVTVIFEQHTDIYFDRQIVFERLQQAKSQLPEGSEPEMAPIATAMGRIYQYELKADSLNDIDRRTIQDWQVRFQLKTVPGVTDVLTFGGNVKQYQVLVDPQKLLKYDLTLSDIENTIPANNKNAGGQFIEIGSEEAIVRGLGWVESVDDIENIVIAVYHGTPIYIKDVAEVKIGPEIRRGVVSKDGKGEIVCGIVLKLIGENSKKVTGAVREKVKEINTALPEGVLVVPWYDQMNLVNRCIKTVTDALLQGGLLAMLVIFLFLYNIRTSIVVLLAIPFSILIAFIFMDQMKLSANLMSLGGLAIAIGMIVDAFIVMVENIYRHLSEARAENKNPEIIHCTLVAAKEVSRPIVFAIAIVIIVFVPLFTLKGVEGIMFSPMAYTISFAMLGSLILSITVAPVLCTYFVRGRKSQKDPAFLRVLKQIYLSVLRRAITHKGITLGIAVTAFALSLCLVPLIGTEFLPPLNEGWLEIRATYLRSISLNKSAEMATQMEKMLLAIPEIERVVSQTGRPEAGIDPEPISNTEMVIKVKPEKDWTSVKSWDELTKVVEEKLSVVPGVLFNISRPIQNHINELLSGIRAQLAIKLFGDDLDELQKYGEQIKDAISEVPGVADLELEQIAGKKQVRIRIDRAQIARYGINVSDVQEIVEIAIGGKEVSEVFEGQKRFAIYLRLAEPYRNTIETIGNLLVTAPSEVQVPLSQIADITLVEGPAQITRENAMRRIVVACNIRGRDQGSFVAEAQRKVKEKVKLPAGYFVEWGGQFKLQREANKRLAIVIPITLLLIFIMLFTSFNSLKNALLIAINIPFAVIGGIVAIYLSGLVASVAALVGFIALFGIAVENGLVMVSYFNKLRQEGMSLKDTLLKGSELRLRPVLMTAMTTGVGLLPLLMATGPGSEIQKPLAVVVVGGLVSSTILTLILVPTLYGWFEKEEVEF